MLSSFRRMSKSKVGVGIMAVIGIVILASFAMGDVSSLRNSNFGLGSTTLAKTGREEVSDRDAGRAMEQALNRLREQNPAANYDALAGDYEPIIQSLIQDSALRAFAKDNGFVLSQRLVGAEIAKLPGTKGLDGKFSDAAYQNFLNTQRLTDPELRRLIESSLIQRLLVTPAAANARLSVGMAQPYASMLLEAREGEIAIIPVNAFSAGLKPSDADVAGFYAAHKDRYIVPEQRTLRIARFGAGDVGTAGAPTEQEIAAYYTANQASYAATETRVISQAVVQDQVAATGIASRSRAGAAFAAAAQPAGLSAADVSVGPQSRAQFSDLASASVAAQAFAPAAKAGTIIGPVKSDLGWHVIRIESVKSEPGKTLAIARPEIIAKLGVDKRKKALDDLVNAVQDGIDDGQSFAELVAKNRLTVSETPLVTAQGKAIADPQYKFAPELAGALKSGFELSPQDKPVVETLPNDGGFALVTLGKEVAAAPAPIASIRDKVAADWTSVQGLEKAKATATAIAAKVASGTPLPQAIAAAGVPLPKPQSIKARRLQLEQAPSAFQPPMKMLFSLTQGKSRMVAMPAANAFAVVTVAKITPGNALDQPALIGRVQGEFQQGTSQEYAQEFLAAVQTKVGVMRNEPAIAATRQRLINPGAAAQ